MTGPESSGQGGSGVIRAPLNSDGDQGREIVSQISTHQEGSISKSETIVDGILEEKKGFP